MSIRAINWAIELGEVKGLTPTGRHILLVLANFSSDEDTSFPWQNTIAKITGRSRQCVNENLKTLEEIGLIEATPRFHMNGGARSSEYKLMIDTPNNYHKEGVVSGDKGGGGVNQDDKGGVNRDDKGVAADDSHCQRGRQGGVNQDDTLNLNLEPSPEPSTRTRKRKTAAWPSDYRDQFWKLYPKKRGDSRKAAYARLEKVEKDDEVEFETVLAGLKCYADRMNAEIKKDPKNERFIAAASVWINQARWETERPGETQPVYRRTVAI